MTKVPAATLNCEGYTPNIEASLTGSDPERVGAYGCYVVALLALVNIFNYMDRNALAILLPLIKEDLKLSDAQLGLLVGFSFSLMFAVVGIPMARWADRVARRTVIIFGITVWSVMTAVSGAAQNFGQLFAARMGVGLGEAGAIPISQSLICDYVPPRTRPAVFSLYALGTATGTMAGMALAGWLGVILGWRLAFVVLGLPGLLVGALVWLTLKEPKRGRFDAAQAAVPARISLRASLPLIFATRTYRWLTAFGVANFFAMQGLNQWLPSFYIRTFEKPIAIVGVELGATQGAGTILGLTVGALIGRLAKDVSFPLRAAVWILPLSLPLGVAGLLVDDYRISLVAMAGVQFIWGAIAGAHQSAVFTVSRADVRATAAAVILFLASIVGYGLSPLAVGLLSDFMTAAHGPEALRYALLLPISAVVLMTITLAYAAKAYSRDILTTGRSN